MLRHVETAHPNLIMHSCNYPSTRSTRSQPQWMPQNSSHYIDISLPITCYFYFDCYTGLVSHITQFARRCFLNVTLAPGLVEVRYATQFIDVSCQFSMFFFSLVSVLRFSFTSTQSGFSFDDVLFSYAHNLNKLKGHQ
jgi:hypothetical protein